MSNEERLIDLASLSLVLSGILLRVAARVILILFAFWVILFLYTMVVVIFNCA